MLRQSLLAAEAELTDGGINATTVNVTGVTFNAKDGEVIAPDAVWNGLFTFLKPELFKMPPAAAR